MNILLVTEVIHPGGAETFVLRLSDALQSRGHNVEILIFYKEIFHEKLHRLLAPGVSVTFANIPFSPLLRKVDTAFFRMNIDCSLRNYFIKRSIQKHLREEKIDVIHSHLLKADKLCLRAAKPFGIPVVTTIHGDYLQFYNKTNQGLPIPLLNYRKKAVKNLSSLGRIVCISDKQIDFFRNTFPEYTTGKIVKIYNGYEGYPAEDTEPLRNKLNIGKDDFVFGMVSRAIPEKGWEEAIKAFIQLNQPGSHLILIGGGDYLDKMEMKYAAHKNIHFIGHSDKPLDWINIMNVGLLPTTYASESLPTAIIEYLCCGIPVIASDAGEIVNMIQANGNPAGVIVPVQEGKVSIDALSAAMHNYITNGDTYEAHRRNAIQCYESFDMNKCVSAYVNTYTNAIENKTIVA